jgi:uncharacterized protein
MINEKLQKLKAILLEYGRVIVAFSGGTDSAFLLKFAADVLGTDNVRAVTGNSETYTPDELLFSKKFTSELGVKHIILTTAELKDERFCSNTFERCYFCKLHFYSDVAAVRINEGIEKVADGSNFDDLGDYRPGRKAAQELGVLSPLIESGLTKEEIRFLSKEMGLVTWDKPANPCLASRFPYGNRITKARLNMVAEAESFLRSEGFAVVRVRHHDLVAKIEVPVEDIPRLIEDQTRERVIRRFREINFNWVAIDLQGYRQGSMNSILDSV